MIALSVYEQTTPKEVYNRSNEENQFHEDITKYTQALLNKNQIDSEYNSVPKNSNSDNYGCKEKAKTASLYSAMLIIPTATLLLLKRYVLK
jgi:hypothetical protein